LKATRQRLDRSQIVSGQTPAFPLEFASIFGKAVEPPDSYEKRQEWGQQQKHTEKRQSSITGIALTFTEKSRENH
jgi:hypothetical protein